MYYILTEEEEVVEVDVLEWARWFEESNKSPNHVRFIRRSDTTVLGKKFSISTVFLGLDHNFDLDGPPLLFETMIFGLGDDSYQTRCSTYEEALKMHENAQDYLIELSWKI